MMHVHFVVATFDEQEALMFVLSVFLTSFLLLRYFPLLLQVSPDNKPNKTSK